MMNCKQKIFFSIYSWVFCHFFEFQFFSPFPEKRAKNVHLGANCFSSSRWSMLKAAPKKEERMGFNNKNEEDFKSIIANVIGRD